MQNILKKLIYFSFLLTFSSAFVFAEESYSIDYYGIVSQKIDNNIAKMTSDLYFTQLSEIQNITVYDKRNTPYRSVAPDCKNIDTENLIFYSEITENEDESWTVSFNIYNKENNNTYTKTKNYDKFHKILIDSKNELKNTVQNLLEGDPTLLNNANQKEKTEVKNETPKLGKKIKIKSIESLFGTWVGESSIDKRVIYRGGRGLVIFKNGASMNITVSIEEKNGEQQIVLNQKGSSNASFYPDLPRKIALDAAVAAPPIKWTMTLYENMIMVGTKHTLIQDKDSYKIGNIPVIWTKIN